MVDKAPTTDGRRLTALGIGLALVLFFAINFLASKLLTQSRLDLTADQQFTLSSGTKEVLAAIDEPIDLRFYYSPQLDEIGAYFTTHAQRVDELLAEYERLSDGKVRVERLDPEPFSAEEDIAVAEGLQGMVLGADGAQTYFGISGRNSTDDNEVIALLSPDRADFLEYDLTRMVHDLGNPEKPVVAVLGDLPLMGSQFNQGRPWLVLDAMFQFFDVRFLGGSHAAIDEDVSVLLLAQPQGLDEAGLYAVDQFVMRGGRVLALVDPFAEIMANGANPMADPNGNAVAALQPLLTAWGVEIPDGQVIGDAQAAQRVGAMVDGREAVIQYLPWLALSKPNFAGDTILTAQLERITLNSVGSIRALEDAETSIEPLLVSSADSMEIDATRLRGMPDPAGLIADFAPSGEPFTLAAKVTGPVKSAFPDGPPEGADEALSEAHLNEASAPLNLILIADADLLADRNWVRSQNLLGQDVVLPIANNGDFAVNALDHLSGSQGLISLRGRGFSVRPFTVVEAMAQDAEIGFRAKEQALLGKIADTQAKIRALQEEEQQGGVILAAEQQAEIDDFRAEMISLRQELREVQRSLRQDVETLSTWVKVVNIWAVPLVIGVVALILALVRRARAVRFAAVPSD